MLAIRLQRTGRHGHAQYRVVVQDSHQSPKSGKVVARLGSYDPHTKTNTIDTEKAKFYLDHGAQPSDRVVGLLSGEGVKMPSWVSVAEPRKRTTRNPEKLRKNQAEQGEAQSNTEAASADSNAAAAENTETPTEEANTEVAAEANEAPAEETPAAEENPEKPAEDDENKA